MPAVVGELVHEIAREHRQARRCSAPTKYSRTAASTERRNRPRQQLPDRNGHRGRRAGERRGCWATRTYAPWEGLLGISRPIRGFRNEEGLTPVVPPRSCLRRRLGVQWRDRAGISPASSALYAVLTTVQGVTSMRQQSSGAAGGDRLALITHAATSRDTRTATFGGNASIDPSLSLSAVRQAPASRCGPSEPALASRQTALAAPGSTPSSSRPLRAWDFGRWRGADPGRGRRRRTGGRTGLAVRRRRGAPRR